MNSRDIFIRLDDPAGQQAPVISQHRVWDADRFVASQIHQYGEGAREAADRRRVSVVSADDYRAYRKGK